MQNVTSDKSLLNGWTLFEKVWLVVSTITMVALSIIWKDSLVALTSGVTGIIGVVLCAKGKISTYFYATINVALYAWLCFENKLYGEVMLNVLYFIPMNIIGFILWNKKKDEDGKELYKIIRADFEKRSSAEMTFVEGICKIAKKYIDFSRFETNLENFLKNE